ncbi:Ser-Thr-rich glycosyl-phosphatidyl-inositol-anchored membrane family-domain-containing protein [Neurospora tetraspora]|uniref:Ser-Thr-rich glycosyl-phosphatidyl-inositol-anchored membrane family-domain-containing protein n=1 Tax=Neurospora tetraspora TaxID=94610 RepID=A0AAE0MWK9_9PEZI|nr:Ser-Thr-rich glycosyl-phosphatidyl-inositol-anchored membrane family-domain-containing protein [Neurospora tetraspora]
MRFSVATVLAIATAVFAQTDGFDVISNPYAGEKVLAGLPCEIQWAPSSQYQGTVRIDVLGGTTPQTLNKVGTIASGVDSSKGSYKWNVDAHLGTANTYGIQITLESNDKVFQYSFPFHIIGGLVDDDATTVAVPTTAAAGTAKPLTVAAPATTKAAIATTKASDAAPATTDAATGSGSGSAGSASDASASGAVSSFSTVVSANASVVASATSSDVVATASASSTGAVATGGAAAFGASTGALLGSVAMALFAL